MANQFITYLGDARPLPMRSPAVEANRYLKMDELIQRDAGNLGKTMEQYAKYKEQEGKVQDIKNFLQFDTASNEEILALRQKIKDNPGLYDKHRQWGKESMDRINKMDFSFSDDLNTARFTSQKKKMLDGINYDVEGSISDAGLNDAKTTLGANMKMYAEQGNWDSYRNTVEYGRGNNLITQGERDLYISEANTKQQEGRLDELLLNNPEGAFDAIDNGEFDDLPSDKLLRYKKTVESYLRTQSKPIPLSDQDRANIEAGKSVSTKYGLRDGATEPEHEWRDHFHEFGNYDKYKGDIRKAWMDDISNMPVMTTKEERDSWMKEKVKQWCSYDMGYGVDMNEFKLLAQDKMDELSGTVDTAKRIDLDTCFSFLSDAQIVPVLQSAVDDAVNSSYLTDERRRLAVNEANIKRNNARTEIEGKTKIAMVVWRSNHKDAGYDKELEQLSLFVARFAKEAGYNEEEKADTFGRGIASYLESKDVGQKDSKNAIEAQKLKNRDYMASQKTFFPWENKKKMSPASECNIMSVSGSEKGAYIPKAEYDSLKKKFGNVYVAVDLPNKAHARVPVLGWYEGENTGVQLTTGARRSLNNFNPNKAKVRFFTGDGKATEGKPSPINGYSASNVPNINDLPEGSEGLLPETAVQVSNLESPLLPPL